MLQAKRARGEWWWKSGKSKRPGDLSYSDEAWAVRFVWDGRGPNLIGARAALLRE
jgi:hypothetical protein